MDRPLQWLVDMRNDNDGGMTLIEVCLAMLVLGTAAFGAAHLFGLTLKMINGARMQSSATFLAARKIENLRASGWQVAGSIATLWPSPANSLAVDSAGFVEYFDRYGQTVGLGPTRPATAVFICRWYIEAHPWNPSEVRVMRVLATSITRDRQAQAGGGRRRWLMKRWSRRW